MRHQHLGITYFGVTRRSPVGINFHRNGRAPLLAEWIFRRRFSLHAWILQGFVVSFAVDFSVDFLSLV